MDDSTGFALPAENGRMMRSLTGATDILTNWIHFNNLSNIQVCHLKRCGLGNIIALEHIISLIMWCKYILFLPSF